MERWKGDTHTQRTHVHGRLVFSLDCGGDGLVRRLCHVRTDKQLRHKAPLRVCGVYGGGADSTAPLAFHIYILSVFLSLSLSVDLNPPTTVKISKR